MNKHTVVLYTSFYAMAPTKRGLSCPSSEASALSAMVVFLSLSSNLVSALCPDPGFTMCACRDLSSIPGDDKVGLDCNRQSISQVVAAVKASEAMRRRTAEL